MQQKASPTGVEISHKQNIKQKAKGRALQTALDYILMKVLLVLHRALSAPNLF